MPIETVLVVEYGDIEYAPGSFDPPQTVWGASGPVATRWSFNSLPSPEVNNKTASILAGQVVGGSSAVNGMFFDRGSRYDFEAWSKAAGSESNPSSERWDWDGIYPFFKKVDGPSMGASCESSAEAIPA